MDEKRRQLPITGPHAYKIQFPNGVLQSATAPPFKFVQTTRTRGHAWPSAGRAVTDVGGDFSTARVDPLIHLSDITTRDVAAFGYRYIGREYAVNPATAINDALNAVSFSTDAKLRQMGTTAIARCLPTNPVADAGTFIGELKAGIPKSIGKELFKTKFKDYRKYGSEYLNVEFGWKPLVSDLQKFGKAAIESEKILAQLHRDSGKNIYRKFTFPDEVVVSNGQVEARQSSYAAGGNLYPYLYRATGGATLRTTVTTVTKTWFSGCFTYYVTEGTRLQDKVARAAAEARKLYGIELTPETVWNLAPWSWAVDWEGNIGDVLHNVTRFSQDGLVMRYGYIMQSKTAKIEYTLAGGGRFYSAPNTNLTMTITSQSKVRRRATPFGFGFDMTALSGRQSAILGALGISRGPRHL